MLVMSFLHHILNIAMGPEMDHLEKDAESEVAEYVEEKKVGFTINHTDTQYPVCYWFLPTYRYYLKETANFTNTDIHHITHNDTDADSWRPFFSNTDTDYFISYLGPFIGQTL